LAKSSIPKCSAVISHSWEWTRVRDGPDNRVAAKGFCPRTPASTPRGPRRLTSTPPWSPHTRILPLHDFVQNQIWCAIVALACELKVWMQTLALADTTPAAGNQTAATTG
jgi:hypothetical protein